jgi:trehalose-phosphatase
LDYDGTLTDFTRNPEHSHLSNKTRALLRQLQRRHLVIMVTGRYADSLLRVSGLKKFPVIGTHGFEARNLPGGLRFTSPAMEKFYKKEAAQIWNAVKHLPQRYPGIHIERKPFSSTLHYRGVRYSPKQAEQLRREYSQLCRSAFTPGYWNLEGGKKMIEVLPRGFNKGKSVKLLLKKFPHHLVIYAGDDTADISVFKVLGKKGFKIAIGNRIPRKYYDLKFKKPAEFLHWLNKIDKPRKE